MFIGRKEELDYLNDLYNTDKFEFAVIYGRRRVGKTTLINEFSRDKNCIFFVAEEYNSSVELEKFSKIVLSKFEMNNFIEKFENLEKLLLFLSTKAKDERLLLIIDEFQYLAQTNKNLLSTLQNTIDHVLKDTKLFIIICGSSVSFMENEVLAYKSPVFGRRTAQFEIKPFDFYNAMNFFPEYDIRQKIEVYSVLGGTPLYLNIFDNQKNIESNIKTHLLKKFAYLYEEPRSLLRQELREPAVYNSIIEAIATGYTKLNQISTKINEPFDKTHIYIKTLLELQIVEKVHPVTEKETSRNNFYVLKDNLFKFVYRYLYSNIELIEQGEIDYIWSQIIEPNFSQYVGHIFEEVCKDYFRKKNKERALPFVFIKIGKWWGNNKIEKKQEEIDIVAINNDKIIFAECKYKNQRTSLATLDDLIRKSNLIECNERFYYLFSKSGFDKALISKSKTMKNVFLVELDEL